MTTSVKPARERKSWDFILTIFLFVVYLGWTLLCCFAGALVAIASDSCGASACSDDLVSTAFAIGTFGPAGLAVIALVFTIVWVVRRHISFWIPIAAAVLALALVALAYVILGNGVALVS